MDKPITRKMLEQAGCRFETIFAFDVTNDRCVAIERLGGQWQLWQPHTWKDYPRRFRVKAATNTPEER